MSVSPDDARTILRASFNAAIAASDPSLVLAGHLPERPAGRTVVVGAGKAAASMAAALEAAWPEADISGLVVTRYGHEAPTKRIAVVQAAHPVPDQAGLAAAQEILAAISGLSADDLVIFLLSGGASSLLTLPAGNLTLADKQAVNRALLASGAPIGEMNIVRKHLSAIKGGRLARAALPARFVTLAISDVPGDEPAIIGSGPSVFDATTKADALTILDRYGIDIPPVSAHLRLPEPEAAPFTADYRMIATPAMALQAAAARAQSFGIPSMILGDAIEGEASALGVMMAGIAKSVRIHGLPTRPPVMLLSGGEASVTIGAGRPGKGGRNTEFLLSLALSLDGAPGIYAIAGDTDGIDGSEDAAGAIITPDTLARGSHLNPRLHLTRHDSYSLFHALGDLVVTGPTLTNVNDIRAILIL